MASPAELELLEQPVPIYLIGESHCMAFRDRLFREKRYFDKTFVCKSLFIPSITTHNFVENGSLNGELMKVLMGAMLLTGGARGWTAENIKPHHVRTTESVGRPQLLPTDPVGVPILVFFVGEIALRAAFLKTLGKRDFDLPFPVPHLDEIPSSEAWDKEAEHVSMDLVLNLFNQVASPLFNGLAALYKSGFTRTYLHSVPPPTLNDGEFEWMHGFHTPARLRYKAAALFNSCFASFCQQYKIGFLNIWDDVTIHNALNPEYYLDGCHLHPKSVPITLTKLMTALAADPRPAIEPRYEFTLKQAQEELGAPVQPPTGWSAGGAVVTTLPGAGEMAQGLEYETGAANRHVRLDWNGLGLAPLPAHVASARPALDTLRSVHDALYAEPLAGQLQSLNGCDFTVVSAQFRRYGPADAQPDFAAEEAPPGVVRAAVYLSDVDDGSVALEYVDAAGASHRLAGAAGTMLVFDPRRVRTRWTAAGTPAEVLWLALMPRHKAVSRFVMWSGLNNWPVDPFNFSVEGFRLYPEDAEAARLRIQLKPDELLQIRLKAAEEERLAGS
jgi:hypothetical protein